MICYLLFVSDIRGRDIPILEHIWLDTNVSAALSATWVIWIYVYFPGRERLSILSECLCQKLHFLPILIVQLKVDDLKANTHDGLLNMDL